MKVYVAVVVVCALIATAHSYHPLYHKLLAKNRDANAYKKVRPALEFQNIYSKKMMEIVYYLITDVCTLRYD